MGGKCIRDNQPQVITGLGNVIKKWAIPGPHPLIRGSAGWRFEDDPSPTL